MSNLNLKWSKNNEKLAKLDTISFNLPAFESEDGFKVCPKAGGCATLCYARQGRYVIGAVKACREFNLAIARGDKERFVKLALEDLARIHHKIVRVHDSGDFFSQTYLDAWFTIAGKFPKKKFYAYTKSLHLDWLGKPPNFQLVQSMGGLMDNAIDTSKSHSRIFVTHKDRLEAGYVNGNINDGPAIRGEQNIGLVYHGVRNLKAGQVAWLRKD